MKILYDNWRFDDTKIIKNLAFIAQSCEVCDSNHILSAIEKINNDLLKCKIESQIFNKFADRLLSRNCSHEINIEYFMCRNGNQKFDFKKLSAEITSKQIQKAILLSI